MCNPFVRYLALQPPHHSVYQINTTTYNSQPRGPQQGEILDTGAEIRDPKSELAIFFQLFL